MPPGSASPYRPASPYRWTLLDLVVATAVATVAWQYRASLADLAIGFGMAVALVWRRRRPVSVMLAVTVLGGLQLFAGPDVPALYDVAVLIAMVAVVTHAGPPVYGWLAGGLVLVESRWWLLTGCCSPMTGTRSAWPTSASTACWPSAARRSD
ncbi:hypothetical protein [Micromonospora sp. LOL_021]|uniref:DUF7134 domain-containing protein n=1 Tax=Micromonospora sp. LOL_021 TaxID=3345417 RepID=UPI003A8B68CA